MFGRESTSRPQSCRNLGPIDKETLTTSVHNAEIAFHLVHKMESNWYKKRQQKQKEQEIVNIKQNHKCDQLFLNRSDYVTEAPVSMRFKKANAKDIIKIINNLSDEKSPGSDRIRAMTECGIRGPLNLWFKAYLQDRTLQTVIDGKVGKKFNITYGVPTGSVYGPVGYSMHVNSMCNVIRHGKAFMYADDTCILYADSDLNIIQQKLQEDLDSVIKWSHDNGIIVNMAKTKCMHIYSPHSRVYCEKPVLLGHSYDCLHREKHNCNCMTIELVSSYKYLGLTIDRDFSWKTHIEKICKVLPVHDKVKLLIALEEYRNTEFKFEAEHTYTTRSVSNDKYVVPRVCNYYGQRTRCYLVPTVYNKLSVDEKDVSKFVFKKKIKEELLSAYEKEELY
ncbi:reverse transcriptase (RNA-dependent DNA polymerase) domain-containing protein [Phthorimaea operculella]|nr:reverse transcriptase (RNA-dependent DNA polymerase) domain-containing protein [Phthorimaea operculella]